jgi:hypothetical protein
MGIRNEVPPDYQLRRAAPERTTVLRTGFAVTSTTPVTNSTSLG